MVEERRRGPKLEGPMQAALSKANIIVVKDTSLGSHSSSQLPVDKDPNAQFRQRQEDILRDQVEFGRQMAEAEKNNQSTSELEQQMEQSSGNQGRVHRITRTPSVEVATDKKPSIRRRIWEIMKDTTEKGIVKSFKDIASEMSAEGYKGSTVVAECYLLKRANNFFEIPKGYESARPSKYLLKTGAEEPSRDKFYIPLPGKEKSAVPADVTKQVQNSGETEKTAKDFKETLPSQAIETLKVHTPTEAQVSPVQIQDPKEAVKAALSRARNIEHKDLADAILESLNMKQTMVLFNTIKTLMGL